VIAAITPLRARAMGLLERRTAVFFITTDHSADRRDQLPSAAWNTASS
jgi:hypothetical protein